MTRQLVVSVPCSTSNLGPGYDCFGLALRLRNSFRVGVIPRRGAAHEIRFHGPEAAGLHPSPDNMFFQAAATVFAAARRAMPALSVDAVVNVPNARGLGSSSTAVAAGIAAANALLDHKWDSTRLVEFAAAFEGHPDNAAPAILGGLTASVMGANGTVLTLRVRPSARLAFVVVSPAYEVRTSEARRVLPREVPMVDAVANASRLPLLFDAMRRGEGANLALLTEDRLHEPYRAPLYPGHPEIKAAARKAGAHACCVSGAGPSVFCIADKTAADRVVAACERALKATGVGGRVRILAPDGRGTLVNDRAE
jgi:homoserine kinase